MERNLTFRNAHQSPNKSTLPLEARCFCPQLTKAEDAPQRFPGLTRRRCLPLLHRARPTHRPFGHEFKHDLAATHGWARSLSQSQDTQIRMRPPLIPSPPPSRHPPHKKIGNHEGLSGGASWLPFSFGEPLRSSSVTLRKVVQSVICERGARRSTEGRGLRSCSSSQPAANFVRARSRARDPGVD